MAWLGWFDVDLMACITHSLSHSKPKPTTKIQMAIMMKERRMGLIVIRRRGLSEVLFYLLLV
jgi:hypothetical protein